MLYLIIKFKIILKYELIELIYFSHITYTNILEETHKMNLKLITDTASSLSQELIDKYDIDMIPIILTDENKSYKDTFDITNDEVYENMKNGRIYKTSQISLSTYYEVFSDYAKKGVKAVYLAMSTGLSSTYYTSLMALNQVKEDYPETSIEILDSKLCSFGHGFGTVMIAKAIQNGADIEEIKKILKTLQDNMVSFGYVSDMESLYRGGRISKTASVVINTLNIKPFLNVNRADGSLRSFGQVRGMKKVYQRIVNIMKEEIESPDFKDNKIWLSHTDNIEDSYKVRSVIKESFDLEDDDFVISQNNACIGAHLGPGSVCVFFLKNNPFK